MSVKEEIIDYLVHSEEIEKWLALKGETKYMRFASILITNGVAVEWNVLKDTYRYDKRLLVNIFKYLSFFEEFLRAQIWNISPIGYRKLEEASLMDIMNTVIELKNSVNYIGFSVGVLESNKDYINCLRNRVSHNKIILDSVKNGKTLKDLLLAFKEILPESYRCGFTNDINNCKKNLQLPKSIIIEI